jgi:hypothetical protein
MGLKYRSGLVVARLARRASRNARPKSLARYVGGELGWGWGWGVGVGGGRGAGSVVARVPPEWRVSLQETQDLDVGGGGGGGGVGGRDI